MANGQFSRWSKKSIVSNQFAENGTDYKGFDIDVEGNKTIDYKLSASFAKKLAMASNSPKGELARNYFIKVEDSLKKVVTDLSPALTGQINQMALMLESFKQEVNLKLDEIKDLHDPETIRKRQEEARRKHDEFIAYCRRVGVNPNDL